MNDAQSIAIMAAILLLPRYQIFAASACSF